MLLRKNKTQNIHYRGKSTMENQPTYLRNDNVTEVIAFDYSNESLPRDFDIRIEVAEQREILEQS